MSVYSVTVTTAAGETPVPTPDPVPVKRKDKFATIEWNLTTPGTEFVAANGDGVFWSDTQADQFEDGKIRTLTQYVVHFTNANKGSFKYSIKYTDTTTGASCSVDPTITNASDIEFSKRP